MRWTLRSRCRSAIGSRTEHASDAAHKQIGVPSNAKSETIPSLIDASLTKAEVVVLTAPKLDGDKLTFTVKVLEGDLAGADGLAAVFIDIIGMPFTPLSFAGVARRTAARTAFYSAAANGAYYHPYGYPY